MLLPAQLLHHLHSHTYLHSHSLSCFTLLYSAKLLRQPHSHTYLYSHSTKLLYSALLSIAPAPAPLAHLFARVLSPPQLLHQPHLQVFPHLCSIRHALTCSAPAPAPLARFPAFMQQISCSYLLSSCTSSTCTSSGSVLGEVGPLSLMDTCKCIAIKGGTSPLELMDTHERIAPDCFDGTQLDTM